MQGSRKGQLAVAAAAIALIATACSSDGDDAAPDATVLGAVETTTPAAPAGCGQGPSGVDPVTASIDHDGQAREYRVDVPAGYDGVTPAPLTLNLHGFTGTIDGQVGNGLIEEAGARGYVVVTPQGLPLTVPEDSPQYENAGAYDGVTFWNFFGSGDLDFAGQSGSESQVDLEGVEVAELGADDVGFLAALLDEIEATHCIDPDRVYSTGMSNGAGMSTTLGCELDDRLAAIGPVAGVNVSGVCPATTPVPVFSIHGDADPLVNYLGGDLAGWPLGNPGVVERMGQWAEHNGCAPEPVETADDPAPGVTSLEWTGCADGAEVVLWTIAGGGHTWPRDPAGVDAPVAVLDFFDAHPGG